MQVVTFVLSGLNLKLLSGTEPQFLGFPSRIVITVSTMVSILVGKMLTFKSDIRSGNNLRSNL